MRDRVKAAAVDGLVFGVKWAIVLLVFALTASILAGDYAIVRQRAEHGQAAFEFIQKKITTGEWKP